MIGALLVMGATASSVVGAALVYLAHPNQFLLARRLSATAGWTGAGLCLVSLGLWIALDGVLVGLSVALTLWMLVGTALPYAAAWSDARRPASRRHAPASRRAHGSVARTSARAAHPGVGDA